MFNSLLRNIVFLFTFFVLVAGLGKTGLGQIVSYQSGKWNSNATWVGGVIPSVTDDVIIDHVVTINTTVEINNLFIGSKGKLVINSSLVVNGNLTMPNNDPELITNLGASVFIFGSAILANKVTVDLSSYFIVLGDFTISGGGGTDINIDNASIYVFGDFDAGSSGLISCDDYDNLTIDKTETCHIGTETAFDENIDEGTIPPEIVGIVNPCTPPSITNPGDQISCDSYTLPTIIGSNLTGNQKYYDGSQANGGGEITNLTLTGSQTVWIFDATSNGCSDEENFLVTINTTPTIDVLADLTACDSYTLPSLTTGNYFTGTGGTGNALSAGDDITTTQTIYVYAETGTTPNCWSENNFEVIVNPLPTAGISYSGSPYCASGAATVTQTGQAGGTYSSTSGLNIDSSTGEVDLETSTAGTYMVTYSFSDGTCSNTATTSITINALPTVTAIATSTEICEGESVTLTGGGASSYVWDNGVSDGVAFAPVSTSTYAVTGTDANGCSNTDQITVTANLLPTPADANIVICADETSTDLTTYNSTVLDGETGTVAWYDGDPSVSGFLLVPATAVNLDTLTDLWAEVTLSSTGCKATIHTSVTINPLPATNEIIPD